MNKRIIALLLLSSFMLSACAKGGEQTTAATPSSTETVPTETTETSDTSETSETTEEATTATTTEMPTVPFESVEQPKDAVPPEGYHFVWGDEFNGKELNTEIWNRERHEKGWVNHELQEYKLDEEYAYVKDGNLIIQPTKVVDDNGEVKYYSGRVNTCDKFTVKYGRIEARIKTPEGVGFLPAFWMLPNRGRWPIGGEIDIMEIVGGQEDTVHSTLHYGNPHAMGQGSQKMDVQLSKDYHIYACEWDPAEIRFYIDGVLYHTETEWYSAAAETLKYDYPAPFNKPFYIIFNVAVGGDWPGDPDENTTFDKKAQMRVDWVRVYQKDQ